MLTLVLLILVAICTALIVYMIKVESTDYIQCLTFLIGFAGVILLTIVLILTYEYCETITLADQKIKLYTEQNKDIEDKVALVVDKYLEHEKNTYTSLKPESKITLASMYPELQSNQLVQQQIQLYNENNKKLTNCKLQKMKSSFYRKLIVPFS